MPNDDHGDPRNITQEDLEAAAEAGGLDLEDVLANIDETAVDLLDDDYYEFEKEES